MSLEQQLSSLKEKKSDLVAQNNIYHKLLNDLFSFKQKFTDKQNEFNRINNNFKNCTFDDGSYLGYYTYGDVKDSGDNYYEKICDIEKFTRGQVNSILADIRRVDAQISEVRERIRQLALERLRNNTNGK